MIDMKGRTLNVKMQSILSTAALSALTYSTLASADPQRFCPSNDICYTIAVPEGSASSGSGNIYIQVQAPTSYQWVGLGQGTSMQGSNMFLLYTDGNNNVTISPRSGTGYVPPQENPDADVELLSGSGVENNVMTANFRCGNCDSWSGGNMRFSDTNSNWVHAWREGDALATTDKNVGISRHSSQPSGFQLDLTQATVSGDSNPFVDGGNSGSGNNNAGGSSGSGGGSGSNSGQNGGSGSGAITPGGPTSGGPSKIVVAHWAIMLVVWVIMYPLGSALMPLLGKWAIHAAWQAVAFLLMWAGFGLGYVASQRTGIGFRTTHTTFGTVVVCLTVLQPVGGYLHHLQYLKRGGRTVVSHAHIWYGRALMIMGVVNGGLGIRLAGGRRSLTIGYSVAAAVVAVIYLAAKGVGVARSRSRARRERERGAGSAGSDPDTQAAKESPRRTYA